MGPVRLRRDSSNFRVWVRKPNYCHLKPCLLQWCTVNFEIEKHLFTECVVVTKRVICTIHTNVGC